MPKQETEAEWVKRPRPTRPKQNSDESDAAFQDRLAEWKANDRAYMRAYQRWWITQETPDQREKRLAKARARKKMLGREHLKKSKLAWNSANAQHIREYRREYDAQNRDLKSKRDTRYRERHAEELKAKRQSPEYVEWLRAYNRNRYYTNLNHRIGVSLRSSFKQALRLQGLSKRESILPLLGCSIPELMAHIEKQFQPGMSWDNYGMFTWHIDHIKPCAWFDLSKPEERAACWHYTNLQPLWSSENWSKGARSAWKRAA